MLIWMCALRCEAQPVIERLRLQKSASRQGFEVYRNEHHHCVISGVGALNMAAATAWSAAQLAQDDSLSWLNLGVAGYKTRPVGSLFQVDEFASPWHPRVYRSAAIESLDIQRAALTSYATEQQQYPDDRLVDMEGYAFMATATRFSDQKWCQSLKVISDNSEHPPNRDKNAISALIQRNMPMIERVSQALLQPVADAS